MSESNDNDNCLPLSTEEFERRKDTFLAESGIVFEIHEATGEATVSFTDEAHAIVKEKAAAAGMDVKTFIETTWASHVEKIRQKSKNPPDKAR